MKIPVTSNVRGFYSNIVKVLSSFAPLNALSPAIKELLAELMYQNYLHKNISSELRDIVIFSTEVRRVMRDNLNISEDTFNVYLNRLRKFKVLNKDNRLPILLSNILPDKEFEFTLIFKINEKE